jgi:hypothetical protein
MTAILSNTLARTESLFDSAVALYAIATEVFGVDRELFSRDSEEYYLQVSSELSGVIGRIRGLIG